MADPFLRRLLILQKIPVFPTKITIGHLKALLEEEGIEVSARTLQRDLVYLSGSGIFAISCDSDTKPVGWFWIKGKAGFKSVYRPASSNFLEQQSHSNGKF